MRSKETVNLYNMELLFSTRTFIHMLSKAYTLKRFYKQTKLSL